MRPPLTCLLLVSICAGTAPAQDTDAHPNVLFIAVDDLNDWAAPLGGHPQARTPNLDRLAARSVLFTNAHCAAPACHPSRTALLTGIPPHVSGVYLNSQPWPRAMSDRVTLPRLFREAGYRTLGAGKMFHGRWNDRQAWDAYFPSFEEPRPRDPLPNGRPLSGVGPAHFDWGPIDVEDAAMGDAQIAEQVSAWLHEAYETPFFVACGFYRPHLPWYVPRRFFDRFPLESIELPVVQADDLEDIPEAGREMAKPDRDHRRVVEAGQWKHAVQAYLASMAFADEMLGRVLDALDDGPNAQSTIVVLWGDHGWHLGEKEHWRKFALWEEATRVPLLFALPGQAERSGQCSRTASLLDVYPTLCELCNVTPPADQLAGRSLLPLLHDPDAPWDAVALTTHGRGNHAVRDERFRYIRYRDGSEELYDHATDPMEWRNRAGDDELAEVLARLAAHLPQDEAEPSKRARDR